MKKEVEILFHEALGQLLAATRHSMSISQDEMAAAGYLSLETIQLIEAGGPADNIRNMMRVYLSLLELVDNRRKRPSRLDKIDPEIPDAVFYQAAEGLEVKIIPERIG